MSLVLLKFLILHNRILHFDNCSWFSIYLISWLLIKKRNIEISLNRNSINCRYHTRKRNIDISWVLTITSKNVYFFNICICKSVTQLTMPENSLIINIFWEIYTWELKLDWRYLLENSLTSLIYLDFIIKNHNGGAGAVWGQRVGLQHNFNNFHWTV